MAKWNMKTIHIHQTSSNYFDPHHITGRFQDAFSFLAAFFSMDDSIDDSLADITLIFSLNSRRLVIWCNSPKVANNYRESISGNLRGCWTFFWQNMTKVSKIGPSNHPTNQSSNQPTHSNSWLFNWNHFYRASQFSGGHRALSTHATISSTTSCSHECADLPSLCSDR